MSTQLTQLVPIFDGSNYGIWAKAMKAFLMAQGLWGFVDGTITAPADPADLAAWQRSTDMARGNITLRVSPALQEYADSIATLTTLWTNLKNRYGAATVPMIYKDFKEAISIRFNPNQHPGPQFDKLAAAFARLGAVTFGTPPDETHLTIAGQIQALIAMAALPPKWEFLIPIISQNIELTDLALGDVRDPVIAQWETEKNKGNKNVHQANKLSAVKRKRGDPRFNQQEGSSQQRPDSQNQQPFRQRGSRGKGKGKAQDKGKGKQRASGHVHIADTAALPAPTTHTVAQIGPSTLSRRTVTQPEPKERVPGPYKSLNSALTLAERMNVTPTIQTAKTLEQRFVDFNNEVRGRSNWAMDEDYDSEIDVDMSRPGPSNAEPLEVSDSEDACGESTLASAFDSLTVTSDADDSILENRAPTPEYHDPRGQTAEEWEAEIAADPDARYVDETWERMMRVMKDTPGYRMTRTPSNEVIERIHRQHQEYLSGLISPRGSRPGTPNPYSVDEPLDWGTDSEKYATCSNHSDTAYSHIVSDHPRRSTRDGSFDTGKGVNNVLPNVGLLNALDVLECEHDVLFSQCAKCRLKLNSMWLLDSGASAHFTNNLSDFIEYKPASPENRTPVRTAAHTIYVEGEGTILLKHLIN